MAVQKQISYRDKNSVLRTVAVNIDLEKLAFGDGNDTEEVYLTVSAPGVPTEFLWRRNIDGMVEDALYASGVPFVGPAGTNASHYVNPSGAYGVHLVNGLPLNVSGVITQLRNI